MLLCLVSAVAYSISLILQKPLVGRLPAVHVTWLACTIGAISCLPFAGDLVAPGAATRPRPRIWWLVYLGVFPTAIAFTHLRVRAQAHERQQPRGDHLPRARRSRSCWAWSSSARRRPRWRTPAARSPWSASPSPGASRVPEATRRTAPAGGRRRCTPLTAQRLVRRRPSSSSRSGPRNASRLRVGSPRETRHSHSLRMEEAKPSSRIVLNEPSAYSRTAPSSRSISSVVAAGQRQPRVEVDVAHAVEGERDGVHLHVPLQQPPVDALEVLVGLAAHERVHLQCVPADVEAARRLQLLLARAASTISEVGETSLTTRARRRRRPGAGRPAPASRSGLSCSSVTGRPRVSPQRPDRMRTEVALTARRRSGPPASSAARSA